MYDILGFLNFIHLLQITQEILLSLIFLVTENFLILFYCSFHFRQEKINLCNLASFYH